MARLEDTYSDRDAEKPHWQAATAETETTRSRMLTRNDVETDHTIGLTGLPYRLSLHRIVSRRIVSEERTSS
jgi:hypothetical protein